MKTAEAIEHTDVYSSEEKNIMLKMAYDSIQYGLEHGQTMSIQLSNYSENLQKKRACFVTLEIDKELRGCIGSLVAHQPLIQDIVHNAFAAAFEDPRFPPVNKKELPQLSMHISILSIPERMTFQSEADLLQQIRPNIDGLILSDNGYQGTFLPSVWEELSDPKDFLRHLKMKAGLPQNYWSNTLQVYRYETQMIEKPRTIPVAA